MTAPAHPVQVALPGGTVAGWSREGDPAAPALVVMHQTPLSSWTHQPLLAHLRHPGRVLLLDSPGYGHSTALPAGAPLIAYADRLWAAVEELVDGARVVLLGQHTGAHLAMLLAPTHRDRVDAVIFHGLSLYTDDERAERAAAYAPRITSADDGSHLLQIWARLRRLYPDAAPDLLDRSVIDYLQARPDYAHAYRAVFALPVAEPVRAFREAGVPSAVLVGTRDLIAGRQDRVTAAFGSPVVWLDGLSDFAPWEDPAGFARSVDGLLDNLLTAPRSAP